MNILSNTNFNKTELQNGVFQVLASAPGSPIEGQFYYDSVGQALNLRTSSTWVALGSGSGSVTTLSVVSTNGFAGSVANASTTPAITLTTTITGLLKGNGTAISAASAGTDYLTPTGNGSGLTALNGTEVTTGTVAAARLPALNAITAPAADLSLNSFKITSLATPVASTDAATKGYVDTVAQGLDPKPGATAATDAPLPACTYANGTSGVGATLTGDAAGALTVDSYAVAAGDIILVKDQVAGLQNGTNSADPTIGTTAITFSGLSGATSYSAGTGITVAGSVISINVAYVGQASITTLGTITTGTWTGTTIAVANGGTGQTTAALARGTSGVGAGTAATTNTNTTCTSRGIARLADGVLTGTGAATTFAFTHNLGTKSVLVQVRDSSDNAVIVDWVATDVNTVTLTFAVAVVNAVTYNIVIAGF